jgi:hypothetical protein
VVIVDAFVGPRTPAELTSLEFWNDVRRVLSPRERSWSTSPTAVPLAYGRRVLAGLAACFSQLVLMAEASTLKGRRFGNVVLVGSDAPLPVDRSPPRPAGPPTRIGWSPATG